MIEKIYFIAKLAGELPDGFDNTGEIIRIKRRIMELSKNECIDCTEGYVDERMFIKGLSCLINSVTSSASSCAEAPILSQSEKKYFRKLFRS